MAGLAVKRRRGWPVNSPKADSLGVAGRWAVGGQQRMQGASWPRPTIAGAEEGRPGEEWVHVLYGSDLSRAGRGCASFRVYSEIFRVYSGCYDPARPSVTPLARRAFRADRPPSFRSDLTVRQPLDGPLVEQSVIIFLWSHERSKKECPACERQRPRANWTKSDI